jgi:hypothetical protein
MLKFIRKAADGRRAQRELMLENSGGRAGIAFKRRIRPAFLKKRGEIRRRMGNQPFFISSAMARIKSALGAF